MGPKRFKNQNFSLFVINKKLGFSAPLTSSWGQAVYPSAWPCLTKQNRSVLEWYDRPRT